MDADRFDRLAAAFATRATRRAIVGLAAGVLAGVGLAADDRAALAVRCRRRQWKCTAPNGKKFCCPDGTTKCCGSGACCVDAAYCCKGRCRANFLPCD